MRTKTFDPEQIRTAFARTSGSSRAARMRSICSEFKCSPGTVARALNGRVTSKSPAGPGKLGGDRSANVLPVGHPATMEKRTVFQKMVLDVDQEWLLKSGDNSGKIGGMVRKGAWKGFAVYTLTLEERATCPTSCRHWSSCYGNSTPFARRWRHGDALEWRLVREVAALELDHPGGFAVRLHNLGDFYSVGYVRLWRGLVESCDALRVFGFTARTDTARDEIAYELAMAARDLWPRFAIRFSNAAAAISTVTIESPIQKPDDAFICPAQWTPSGKKTESCSTCALCWSTRRRVAFLQH